ncbi:MAG: LysM peptidoglycan-binding domain-containing protein [Lachnospiraceae bacterium]|nr:LysM peptidoglycan-binding domain-containing protein [Lachnospiraceae bacterium]
MSTSLSERRIRNNRIRRRRELRRHFYTLLLTLILSAGISVTFFSFRTKAQNPAQDIQYKYYKSISVETGDTLWSLAEEYSCPEYYESYQEYIDEVIRMNGLPDDRITAGQYLIIPYYDSEFVG